MFPLALQSAHDHLGLRAVTLLESWRQRDRLARGQRDNVAIRPLPGRHSFLVDGTDFSARWGWVPVLDFVLGLRALTDRLLETSEVAFEFTESDATIEVERQGDSVIIANYTSGTTRARYAELSLETERFVARVVDDFTCRYAGLARNEYVAALARTLTTSG